MCLTVYQRTGISLLMPDSSMFGAVTADGARSAGRQRTAGSPKPLNPAIALLPAAHLPFLHNPQPEGLLLLTSRHVRCTLTMSSTCSVAHCCTAEPDHKL